MRAGNGKRVLVFAEGQGRKVASCVFTGKHRTYHFSLINKKAVSDKVTPTSCVLVFFRKTRTATNLFYYKHKNPCLERQGFLMLVKIGCGARI